MNINVFDRANYPPMFLVCFLPLSYLTGPTAYVLWIALQYVSLLAVLYLLIGRDQTLPRTTRASIASLAVLFFPLYDNFCYGQIQLMILLGLLVVNLLLARRSDVAAGIVLSFLVLVKLYPLMLVGYLLVRRRWRAINWMAIGLCLGSILTWLALGRDLPIGIMSVTGAAGNSAGAQSITGAFKAMADLPSTLIEQGGFLSLSDQMARLARLIDPEASVRVIAIAIVLGLGVALLVAVYVTVSADERWNHDIAAFSVWVVLAPLITHAYQGYGVFLLMPFAILAGSVVRHEAFLPIAGWLMLAAYTLANLAPLAPHSLLYPMLAVFKELLTIGFVAACFYALSIHKGEVGRGLPDLNRRPHAPQA
ncbi:MAG TPA: glycosyltransferase family 87 protein [Candidatus Binataceae bacterium]|nr:glycosyltransferase family 87 protein [Candidatus Binataceae bacterium]